MDTIGDTTVETIGVYIESITPQARAKVGLNENIKSIFQSCKK